MKWQAGEHQTPKKKKNVNIFVKDCMVKHENKLLRNERINVRDLLYRESK